MRSAAVRRGQDPSGRAEGGRPGRASTPGQFEAGRAEPRLVSRRRSPAATSPRPLAAAGRWPDPLLAPWPTATEPSRRRTRTLPPLRPLKCARRLACRCGAWSRPTGVSGVKEVQGCATRRDAHRRQAPGGQPISQPWCDDQGHWLAQCSPQRGRGAPGLLRPTHWDLGRRDGTGSPRPGRTSPQGHHITFLHSSGY